MVISRVISPQIWVIAIFTLVITPFITTHEPLSKPSRASILGLGSRMFLGVRSGVRATD